MWISLLQALGLAWWVEVKTELPHCVYYFGPFSSSSEAETAKPGYVEDLERENAEGVIASVRRGKPNSLTVEYPQIVGGDAEQTPAFTM
ncbi:MAG: DUF1816 domain-containing protein [Cyanobacteria bacterium P01_E01_bin.6]